MTAEQEQAVASLREAACAEMRDVINLFVEAVTDFDIFLHLGGQPTPKLKKAGAAAKKAFSTTCGQAFLDERERMRKALTAISISSAELHTIAGKEFVCLHAFMKLIGMASEALKEK